MELHRKFLYFLSEPVADGCQCVAVDADTDIFHASQHSNERVLDVGVQRRDATVGNLCAQHVGEQCREICMLGHDNVITCLVKVELSCCLCHS